MGMCPFQGSYNFSPFPAVKTSLAEAWLHLRCPQGLPYLKLCLAMTALPLPAIIWPLSSTLGHTRTEHIDRWRLHTLLRIQQHYMERSSS